MMKIHDFPNLVLNYSTKRDGNMSFVVGEKGALQNRKRFLNSLGLKLENTVFLLLRHTDKVYKATKNDLGKGASNVRIVIEKDALITNKSKIYLALLSADCLPIAVYDSKKNAIGLLHASKYNNSKIIKNTIQKMRKSFGSKPKDLVVNIGPSIGPCHYEIDLWNIAENELTTFGVLKKNIYNPKICTFEASDYFSHREAKAKDLPRNRFATLFGMK